MLCNSCNVELRVDRFKDDVFYFKCMKCGNMLQKTRLELEEEYNKVK